MAGLNDYDYEPAPKPQPRPIQWVVCAANRHKDGRIVAGARHYDGIMRAQIGADYESWKGCEQGFIDQFGQFLTREQALVIARANGQIRRRCGGDEHQLYSENLY
jgi:hypothetical protein